MKKILTSLLAVSNLSGCVIHISPESPANHQLEKKLTLSTTQISSLHANVDSGDIKIIGVDGLSEIRVDANILTTKDERFRLTLEQHGDRAQLIAKANTNSNLNWYNGQSPRIDLTISIPSNLAVNLDDSSGDIEISNIQGRMEIDDSSGDIILRNIASAKIDDGSGDISIEQANDLKIDDGSGDINIKVAGNIEIDDGSGSITIVTAKDVEIDDGSGGIYVRDIEGKVAVVDSSGNIDIENISGHVQIEDESGNIRVVKAGSLTISDDTSGSVDTRNISGSVIIDGQHSLK
ncbi:hypothetical protein ACSLBF_16925 [Pseudoalteromonas sp. T1lg65]|uniref:hypothetical protein n=1 Tax=Pseudoalteromonas sp. T1lg65 TaxID=2077101 RepID=UPI003F79BC2F